MNKNEELSFANGPVAAGKEKLSFANPPVAKEVDLLKLVMERTAREQHAMLNPTRVSKVEHLPEELRDSIMDWAQEEGVDKLRQRLRGKGFIVARATLSRHLRKQRAAEAAEVRDERVAEAKEVVSRAEGETFRTGAMEALRGKIFDRAQNGGSVEESLQLYQALTGEEERLKKLRLQERELELKAERLRIEAARGGAKLFLEALKILDDAALSSDAKVERVRAQLAGWRGGAIEVEVKRIGEGDGKAVEAAGG